MFGATYFGEVYFGGAGFDLAPFVIPPGTIILHHPGPHEIRVRKTHQTGTIHHGGAEQFTVQHDNETLRLRRD